MIHNEAINRFIDIIIVGKELAYKISMFGLCE